MDLLRFLTFQIPSSSFPLLILGVCTVLLGFRMDMLVGQCVGIMSARGYFLALVPFETWLPAIESSTLCRSWRAFVGAYIPNAEGTTASQTSVDEM